MVELPLDNRDCSLDLKVEVIPNLRGETIFNFDEGNLELGAKIPAISIQLEPKNAVTVVQC